jgi:hypothetical protein
MSWSINRTAIAGAIAELVRADADQSVMPHQSEQDAREHVVQIVERFAADMNSQIPVCVEAFGSSHRGDTGMIHEVKFHFRTVPAQEQPTDENQQPAPEQESAAVDV